MKIFNKKQKNKKSWCIDLIVENNDAHIIAVDSVTGEEVAALISFYENGEVNILFDVKNILEDNYYDAYEHNNKFDKHGSIIIEKEWDI